jgi:hypothetical protein
MEFPDSPDVPAPSRAATHRTEILPAFAQHTTEIYADDNANGVQREKSEGNRRYYLESAGLSGEQSGGHRRVRCKSHRLSPAMRLWVLAILVLLVSIASAEGQQNDNSTDFLQENINNGNDNANAEPKDSTGSDSESESVPPPHCPAFSSSSPPNFLPPKGSPHSTRFFIPEIPSYLNAIRSANLPVNCEFFGHMYSFEHTFQDFLTSNSHAYIAENPLDADFILVPHCVTFAYHVLRYQGGYTRLKVRILSELIRKVKPYKAIT